MSRKGTREKNDISITFGNLPQRLQRKFAEDVGDTTSHGTGNQQAATRSSSSAEVDGGGRDVPSIDFFMKKSAKTCGPLVVNNGYAATGQVMQNGIEKLDAPPTTVDGEQTGFADDVAAIPGLLRVNAAQVAKTTSNKNGNSREKSRKHGRSHRDDVALLPKSPAHQQVKATYPTWFDAAEATHANGIHQLHDKYVVMLQQNTVLKHWNEFWLLHQQLQLIFTQLLLHHLKFSCEQKVDTFFWKLLFYNSRESLKTLQPNSAEARNCILSLLNNGLEFYNNLHAQLCDKYLKDAPASEQPHNAETCERFGHKCASIAKVMVQKLLICLGDLSRYKTKQLQLSDYSEASKYYQRAQSLIPTNGIPYNQLAIIAILNRKQFDAIYFHMRSLMSSNAIFSAKESLLVLFDEIRKKYEETEMKASPIHHASNSSKSLRKEIWIYPDGVRRLHRTNINANKTTLREENRLNEMPTDELLRRFISFYLYILGKLYTGIGMETIYDHQRKLLGQLNALLKRDPLVFSRSRLLKLLALNIFVLQQNTHNDSRREIRYHASNFCNQFLGLIVRKCNQLFSINAANSSDQNFTDLNTLLQYTKGYTDFLGQNLNIWEPLRSEEHAVIDCWTELQQLFQHIAETIRKRPQSQRQHVVLEEDVFFLGFTPLSVASATNGGNKKCKCHAQSSFEAEQFDERLAILAAFGQCYKQNGKRLELAEESFVLEECSKAMQTALKHLESVDDENSENIVVNGCAPATPAKLNGSLHTNSDDNAQLTQLSQLKKELEAKSIVKKMYNAKLEEILNYVDTKVYIEVRPKYLLPDTNCFIDCLEDFEMLVQAFKRYTLIIPLTVVKELDGLAKGVKLESFEKSLQKQRIHHLDDVTTRAKKSLDFIKTAKNNIKCATTKGSIINASLFALVEEEYVSNDDKILATAVAVSKTMSISNETSKDGKCLIQTELVLITTDRNLRVKALSRNLAVSELCEFLQWAKNCNT